MIYFHRTCDLHHFFPILEMYMYVDYDAAIGIVRMNQSTVLQRPQSYPIQINYQSASTKVKIILILFKWQGNCKNYSQYPGWEKTKCVALVKILATRKFQGVVTGGISHFIC